VPDQVQLEFADKGSWPPIVMLTFRHGICRAFGAESGPSRRPAWFQGVSVYQINPNYLEAVKGQGPAARLLNDCIKWIN
jgi:hypothetical protein